MLKVTDIEINLRSTEVTLNVCDTVTHDTTTYNCKFTYDSDFEVVALSRSGWDGINESYAPTITANFTEVKQLNEDGVVNGLGFLDEHDDLVEEALKKYLYNEELK